MSDAYVLEDEERRLRGLCDGQQHLLAYGPTSETEDGVYYITLREWPHPDVEDAHVLAIRYAYLTRGAGSDGWVDGGAAGVNMRVEGDVAEFVASLAQMVASARPRIGTDARPSREDLRPTEE